MKLEEIIKAIKPLDESAMRAARARQDTLTKPPGSLGRLEELSIQLAGMKADPFPSVEHKAVIVLRTVEGLSYKEIGAILGCSEGTVMSRLHYARKKLHDKLSSFL